MRRSRNHLLLYAKGLAMGAADVVPGVSGGTIAFISGIYEELVDSLRALNPASLVCLFREGPAVFWRRINGTFLLVLLAGIVTSLLSLARAAQFALAHYPLLIWSFFFGLILASIFYVSRQQRLWRAREWTGLVLGTAVALASALTPPLDLGTGTLTLLGAGMLAICAMILPGVSGSFILLMLGLYPVVINAMSGLDPSVLVPFAVGAIVGLLLFSNLLSWLLHHHHSTTLSVLTGFLVGSLAAVWPWKIGGAATAPELLTPGAYAVLVGDPRLVACAAATATGLVLVLALEYLGGNGLRRPEKSI